MSGRRLLFLALLMLAACGRSVDVVDAGTDLHLSGNWNDSDSRVVAESLSAAVVGAAWIADFEREHGRKPVLRLGRIVVRTRSLDDVVEPAIFANDLTRALIASQRVRVVADRGEAAIQTVERQDVAVNAAAAPPDQAALAPDVILSGTLLTQDDRVLDQGLTGTYRQVKFYQLDVAVTDLTTNEVLWRDSVERKKTIEQSTLGW